MLNHILRCATYLDGGRGPDEFDCYGLARHLRHYLYGRRLLSEWGEIRADDYRGMTGKYDEALPVLEKCKGDPKPGALSLAFRTFGGHDLLVHIGCVVEANGKRQICDIRSSFSHPRLISFRDFKRCYPNTSFYDDRDLSVDAAGSAG